MKALEEAGQKKAVEAGDAPLLVVDQLTIQFPGARASAPTTETHATNAIENISFCVPRGASVALVGESGSGKTLSCKAALGILPKQAKVISGSIWLKDPNPAGNATNDSNSNSNAGQNLLDLSESALRRLRGNRISMIFQEPMSALSPLHTIGSQTIEAVKLHTEKRGETAREACLEIFQRVGFPDPERAYNAYPFELSGGLRQRAMIAMAMVTKPDLLIADEPTTALDVTTQAQVLGLIKELQAETGMSVLMISHDLGVVANVADYVTVMRAGKVVEAGTIHHILTAPRHAYLKALIAAARFDDRAPHDEVSAPANLMMRAVNVAKTYQARGRAAWSPVTEIPALRDISLTLARGETLAIVGESGSGKSTFAKLLMRSERADPGSQIEVDLGEGMVDVMALRGSALRRFRRKVQLVFQDPFASLNPRLTIGEILTEPLTVHKVASFKIARQEARDMMALVGLDPGHLNRHPHAFSGGQRQRICIARALMLKPKLLVLDEPTSALDVSVQAKVLKLLVDLKDRFGLTYVFISHDLGVVAHLADQVAVMRKGRIVESGPYMELLKSPRHPYTKALIAASPEPNADQRLDLDAVARGAGEPEEWSDAFRFAPQNIPTLSQVAPGHFCRERL